VSVIETTVAMELCQVMGLPLDPDALDFVRRCERPPFGIDINPTSVSSSLECLRAGLHLLCLFGVTPMYPEEIRNYTRSCQTDTGGFGRVPGAIARLDDTLQTLEILLMVQGHYSRICSTRLEH
jgi:prenyltransferase beta subunit